MVWDPRPAVIVVVASKGYGYKSGPKVGEVITGIGSGSRGSFVFHAGTKHSEDGKIITEGGRALEVTALGTDLERAISFAYKRVNQIHWQSEMHRTDYREEGLRRARGLMWSALSAEPVHQQP